MIREKHDLVAALPASPPPSQQKKPDAATSSSSKETGYSAESSTSAYTTASGFTLSKKRSPAPSTPTVSSKKCANFRFR